MIGIIFSALKIIILLGFLIFIHEFGHFTVAKLCKVKVNEFAIGFGPMIFKKQYKETKYELRLIPLGGFVSMEGENGKSEDKRSFSNVKIPKRIAIVAAGGLVNIIFALAVFFGLQLSSGENITTKVESTIEGYAAESVGIQPGDIIKKVNGKSVVINTDVNEILDKYTNGNITLTIERAGKLFEQELVPTSVEYYSTGMFLEDEHSTKIQGFAKNDSVESQGFKIGDTIISVDGVNIENDANKLTDILQDNYGKESFTFVVRRLGNEYTIQTTPVKKRAYYLGIVFAKEQGNFLSNIYYSGVKTNRFAFSIVDNLKQLISGNVSTSDFMGPVGISKAVAKTDGIREFISMLALISLSLGVTNLLPFPPLDGGKIVILLIEAVRKKPLDEKYEVGIQMLGFGLMIMLSLYVTYHDILRII